MAGAHRPTRAGSTSSWALWSVAALLVLTCVAAAGLALWWVRSDDGVPAGTYVAPTATSTTSATSAPSPSSTPARRTTTTTTQSTTSSTTASPARTRPSSSPPAGEPTRVRVTSGGRSLVDTTLRATYLDADQVLAPPFGTAGWYAEEGWPRPGRPGASILVGHINHGREPDVFWNLPQVAVGDTVTITYGSGRTLDFRITRSEAASKAAVPHDESIWDHDNPDPVLRLITCDPTTPLQGGHYEGNWVVWAELA